MAADVEPPPYHEPTIPFAEQRSQGRAAAGHLVGDQLDHAPAVWRLGSRRDRPVQFYVRNNFLTPDECQRLCAQIDDGVYPSPLYEKDKYADVRTSMSCNLNIHDPLVADIESRITALLGIDHSWGEPLQGQRYDVSQRFKEHCDFFYIDQPYWEQYEPHGGQRTWTAMIYLNEPVSGGATAFKYLEMTLAPFLGRMLIWNNMALDGSPNPWTMHEGQPVIEGMKYVVTKWYRERTFV